MEEWASLETLGFPGYDISNKGEIRNSRTERQMKMSANQEGIVRVGLMKREEGRQVTVSVLRLVARMFVQGRSATFDTPIQLTGNRHDLRSDNIKWRPRWFAVKFYRQFEETNNAVFGSPIYDVETAEQYATSREASMANGILEADILTSVVNGSPCFPTWQMFARVTK